MPAIRKHGGAAELFDALHEELMRETTEEGRTSVATAFDNTCRRVYAGVWMPQAEGGADGGRICILAWGGPEHARGLGTAPALDKVVENAEGDVDKWMVAMAHDVAQQLLGEASVPMDDGASTGDNSENDDIVAAGSDSESDDDNESDESGEEGEEGRGRRGQRVGRRRGRRRRRRGGRPGGAAARGARAFACDAL